MDDGRVSSPFHAYPGGYNSRGRWNKSREQLADRYYGESDETFGDKCRRDARKQNKNNDRYYYDDGNRRRPTEDFKTNRYRSNTPDDYHHDSYDSNRRGDSHRYRCGPRRSGKDDKRGGRSPSPDIRRHNENDDKETEESNSQRKAEEWPPSFEDDGGSAFVFDVRSAMFYEPLSDFFYDPKSKLYYGNKKRAYFRYDEKNDPPFEEVQKMTTEDLERREDGGGIFQEIDRKMDVANKPKIAIAINLKTKNVKSSTSTNVVAMEGAGQSASATVSKAKKQQIANIEKWTELKQSGATMATTTDNTAVLVQQNKNNDLLSGDKVRKTKSGEPICIICKRKFPNLAKLRLHEKASDLHKQNLLKLQQNQKDDKKRKLEINITTIDGEHAAPAPSYTDRAEKRRQLHGSDLSATTNGISSFRRDANAKVESLESCGDHNKDKSGHDPLDETNVGHQMLQRMGWKGSISSDQKGTDDCQGKAKTTNDHLRKDWDHIEAVAANNHPRYRSKF